jgi:hypothetical protein
MATVLAALAALSEFAALFMFLYYRDQLGSGPIIFFFAVGVILSIFSVITASPKDMK